MVTATTHRQRSIVPLAVLAGVVFFVAAATQQSGIVSATVTNTGFLTALYVVVTPFLFWIVRRQRPGAVVWLSVVLAFAGVWGLSGGSLAALNSGDILVACSSVFWATLIIVSGESGRLAQPLTYTCIQFAVVAMLGLLAASLFEAIKLRSLLTAAIPLLYVGVLSTAFTFGLMAIALQTVPAPRASILLSTETVFAAMAGYLFLGERLAPIGWVGAAFILLAVIVIQTHREKDVH
jgi:drug/metabolite transporter (DMT)-like permease